MSAISSDVQKNLMLFSGRAHPELAEQVAKELDIKVTPQTARDFANGEIFVRFEESVRGSDAFVLQSHPAPLNQWIMEQLIMIDALKRGSAKRITAVLPFYPYARQDKKHRGREPISARLIADLLKTAVPTASSPSTCTPIRSRASRRPGRPHARPRPARSVRPRELRHREHLRGLPRRRPGEGRREVGRRPRRRPARVRAQDPRPVVPNQVKSNRVVGDVSGRTCVLIDDMIDTGGTIAGAVEVLKNAGAGDVIIATTHGVFSDPAAERLANCGAKEVIATTRCRSRKRSASRR